MYEGEAAGATSRGDAQISCRRRIWRRKPLRVRRPEADGARFQGHKQSIAFGRVYQVRCRPACPIPCRPPEAIISITGSSARPCQPGTHAPPHFPTGSQPDTLSSRRFSPFQVSVPRFYQIAVGYQSGGESRLNL